MKSVFTFKPLILTFFRLRAVSFGILSRINTKSYALMVPVNFIRFTLVKSLCEAAIESLRCPAVVLKMTYSIAVASWL